MTVRDAVPQRNPTRNLRNQIAFITLVNHITPACLTVLTIPFDFLRRCYGRSGRDLHSCLIEVVTGPWQHKRKLAVRDDNADMLAKLDDLPDEGLHKCVQRVSVFPRPSLEACGGENGGETFHGAPGSDKTESRTAPSKRRARDVKVTMAARRTRPAGRASSAWQTRGAAIRRGIACETGLEGA